MPNSQPCYHDETLERRFGANRLKSASLGQTLKVWRERLHARGRLRQELPRLDDSLLRESGLRREDICQEARKPFWRA